MEAKAETMTPHKFSDAEPIVFMFRPTVKQVVAPDKLKDWENAMRERVGVVPTDMQMRAATVCACNGADPDWDDCDME
jgi:hypothetical protein